MDNLDKIKFKEAESEDWFYKIDLASDSKISFPKKHGYYQEMLAWVEAGNEIEPQFTTEELEQKEADGLKNSIKSQKSKCLRLLKESDYKLLDDFEYPDDLEQIKADRIEWKRIIKSNKIEKISITTF